MEYEFWHYDAFGHRCYFEAYVPTDVILPYSEVCNHMRVSGELKPVAVIRETPTSPPMAQILNSADLSDVFSFPITLGEAGIHYACYSEV